MKEKQIVMNLLHYDLAVLLDPVSFLQAVASSPEPTKIKSDRRMLLRHFALWHSA
jgi:hypothetical protein